jgi:hypothetical protein
MSRWFDRSGLLYLVLLVGETALVWLAVNVIMIPLDPNRLGMPVSAVVVLMAGASLTPWLLQDLGFWGRASSAVAALVLLVTTLAAVKLTSFPHLSWRTTDWLVEAGDSLGLQPSDAVIPVWPVIILSAAIWWRNQFRSEPTLDSALNLLRYGAPLALLSAVGQAAVRGDNGDREPAAAIIVFFVATLIGIAMARPRSSASEGGGAEHVVRWLGTVIGPVLLILLVALLIAGVASRDVVDTILWFLSPLFWVLGLIFRVVIFAFVLVAMVILFPLLWLISLLPLSQDRIAPDSEGAFEMTGMQSVTERAAEVPDPIRYLIAATVLFVLFAGATRLVIRQRRRTPEVTETRTSVLVASDLLGALMNRLRRPLQSSDQVEADPLAALRGSDRWQHTVAIRVMYGDFLRWCQTGGFSRPPGTTPDEHARRLAGRFDASDLREAVWRLTRQYGEARYSDEPATADDAEAARRAWSRLQNEGVER